MHLSTCRGLHGLEIYVYMFAYVHCFRVFFVCEDGAYCLVVWWCIGGEVGGSCVVWLGYDLGLGVWWLVCDLCEGVVVEG